MIGECREHGFYRGDACPACGSEGRFIMSDIEAERLGRMLATVLRHGKYGLEMTRDGYVRADDIAAAAKRNSNRLPWLRGRHIIALAVTDAKGRYQVRGDSVRATYGHTVDVELGLPTDNVPERLYYPVSPESEEIILETGIMPTDRAKVHLSATPEGAEEAGEARLDDGVAVVEVDARGCAAAGFPIGRASPTVFTCDRVPPECVSAGAATRRS